MKDRIAVLIPCLNEELTVGKVVRDFREQLPDAEIHVFDCGALPQDEVPEEFVREVTAWLRANSGTRRTR